MEIKIKHQEDKTEFYFLVNCNNLLATFPECPSNGQEFNKKTPAKSNEITDA